MPATYQLRIRGQLSRALRSEFEGLGLVVGTDEVETPIHGPVVDQAALYGLVRRLEALGLELVELRQYPEPAPEPGLAPEGRRPPDD